MAITQALIVFARPPEAAPERTRLALQAGGARAAAVRSAVAAHVWETALTVQRDHLAHAFCFVDPPAQTLEAPRTFPGATDYRP
ncbi:MAG: hypothetical protein ABI743_13135, partial [bacterium]